MANENKRKTNSEFEFKQFLNFFEELCWLLDSNKEINYKNISKNLNEYRNIIIHCTKNEFNALQNKSKEYNLIGVLPSLLKDEEIFQSNLQLVQFAEEVLSLFISRWEKRSRNEIIGLIICEVEEANKQRLSTLTEWSRNILNNKKTVCEYQRKAKSSGNMFSWNETIQKIVSANDNE